MAKKFDSGKPKMHLIRPEFTEGLAKALTYGAEKYSEYNYLEGGGLDYSRLYSSLLRHLNSFWRGIDIDEESGLLHLECAASNLMMLHTYFKLNIGKDDRKVVHEQKAQKDASKGKKRKGSNPRLKE